MLIRTGDRLRLIYSSFKVSPSPSVNVSDSDPYPPQTVAYIVYHSIETLFNEMTIMSRELAYGVKSTLTRGREWLVGAIAVACGSSPMNGALAQEYVLLSQDRDIGVTASRFGSLSDDGPSA